MTIIPPKAAKVPFGFERYGIRIEDPYAWLRDPEYPEVNDQRILGFLRAENAYFEANMADGAELVECLNNEFKGRIKDDDRSVPIQDGSYLYHWEFEAGAQYRSWYRQSLDSGQSELLIDECALASGKAFFNLRSLTVSPDESLLAYAVNDDGSERYRAWLKPLSTADEPIALAENISGSLAWAADSKHLFYVELNDQLRPYRVRRLTLGGGNVIVYEEKNPAFFVSLGRTSDRAYVIINSGTHVTSEIRFVDATAPQMPPQLISPRSEGHRYSLDHAHGRFWIATNDKHANFRLVSAPVEQAKLENWREEIDGNDRDYLLDHRCFADFIVLSGRRDGLSNIRIRRYDGSIEEIAFNEEAFSAGLSDNRQFDTDKIRLYFTSMTTPASVLEYDVNSREMGLLKRQEISSGYDPEKYRSERLMATANDGAQVPISIAYRRDFERDGRGKLLLYGYGSYGMGIDPGFSSTALSLLDRGFCYAIAHVRGGDELGDHWYQDGKLARKTNSFTDFIACAETLIDHGYSCAGNIAIRGGSAGGMLMGAVANLRPELWRAVVAQVPFVDVLSTMLDDSLPLTPIEWPEWGNPLKDEEAFHFIKSYCPYTNIKRQTYPAMMVTAGISDPRVTYWEPAKYVARLRELKLDDHLLVLKTNMDSGHFGASGRYDSLKEMAEVYAFVIRCFDAGSKP